MNITKEDLLKEISEPQLIGYSDLNGTGELNQSVIDDSISDSISFIESFIIIPDNPTALLKQIAVNLTIRDLKRKQSLLSNDDKEQHDKDQDLLIKMSRGTIKTQIDTSTTPTLPRSGYAFRHNNRRYNTEGFNS